jgi:AraC family transcriptional regulator
MSTTLYSAPPPDLVDSPRSNPRSRRETLAGLIEAASVALDSDRDTARACIAKAAALLKSGSPRTRWRDTTPGLQRGGLAPWQARRVASYVADHLGARIRTTDLAEVAQLSASHFTRAFKETFGETPLGYVSRQRMRYAQDLMLRSGECLSQIALTCGHCDQSHFTRVFRRKVGMSPRAWRRQFASNMPLPEVHPGYFPGRNSDSTLPNR